MAHSGAALWCLMLGVIAQVCSKTLYNSKGWEYVGCYKDARPRDLTSTHKDVSALTGMSLERCYAFCNRYQTQYMALQAGNECRCDNAYGRYGKTAETECKTKCTRDSSQTCGGSWANSVYKILDNPATFISSAMVPLKVAGSSLTFTHLGDWGKDGPDQQLVAKALGTWSDRNGAAFTIAGGDNFYETGVASATSSRFKTTWLDVYTHKALSKPWLIIEGNHDYLLGNAPYQVERGFTDKRWVIPSLYYSMHQQVGLQDIHFIFLDTQPLHTGDDEHQIEWFQKEISGSKSDWILVIGHHPIFSSGTHGQESETNIMYSRIRPLLLQHKAALYICGHDHFLEHLLDSAGSSVVEYVLSGSGGKLREASASGQSNLSKKGAKSAFFKSEFGFVGFVLQGNSMQVTYIDKNGNVVHSFSKQNPRRDSSSIVIG